MSNFFILPTKCSGKIYKIVQYMYRQKYFGELSYDNKPSYSNKD